MGRGPAHDASPTGQLKYDVEGMEGQGDLIDPLKRAEITRSVGFATAWALPPKARKVSGVSASTIGRASSLAVQAGEHEKSDEFGRDDG